MGTENGCCLQGELVSNPLGFWDNPYLSRSVTILRKVIIMSKGHVFSSSAEG